MVQAVTFARSMNKPLIEPTLRLPSCFTIGSLAKTVSGSHRCLNELGDRFGRLTRANKIRRIYLDFCVLRQEIFEPEAYAQGLAHTRLGEVAIVPAANEPFYVVPGLWMRDNIQVPQSRPSRPLNLCKSLIATDIEPPLPTN